MSTVDDVARIDADTIAVGVDGSPGSVAALRWAIEEAKATGRKVRAIAVWTYVPLLDPAQLVTPLDKALAYRRRNLDGLVKSEMDRNPGAEVRAELIEGYPAETLVELTGDAALLVLGSHGRGRLLTALLGSVAASCVRRARCPVLVIPAREAEETSTAAQLVTASYAPGPIV